MELMCAEVEILVLLVCQQFSSRAAASANESETMGRELFSLSRRVFADFNFVIKREKLNSAERMRRDWRMENGEVGL